MQASHAYAPDCRPTAAQAQADYMLAKRLEGVSEHTISLYGRITEQFVSRLEPALPAPLIDARVFKRYLAEVYERDYERATIRVYFAVIKDFGRWLSAEDIIPANPMAEMRAPKPHKRLPRYLSDDEMLRLLGACSDFTYDGVRAKTMILFMVGTGVRVSEMTGVTVDKLDLVSGTVRVVGKGNKERQIIIYSAALTDSLHKWLDTREVILNGRDCNWLFFTRNFTAPHRATVERMLKRYAKKAGIPPLSPHALRHTHGTIMAELINSWRLQKQMGHESQTTTQIYVHLANQSDPAPIRDPLKKYLDR